MVINASIFDSQIVNSGDQPFCRILFRRKCFEIQVERQTKTNMIIADVDVRNRLQLLSPVSIILVTQWNEESTYKEHRGTPEILIIWLMSKRGSDKLIILEDEFHLITVLKLLQDIFYKSAHFAIILCQIANKQASSLDYYAGCL